MLLKDNELKFEYLDFENEIEDEIIIRKQKEIREIEK